MKRQLSRLRRTLDSDSEGEDDGCKNKEVVQQMVEKVCIGKVCFGTRGTFVDDDDEDEENNNGLIVGAPKKSEHVGHEWTIMGKNCRITLSNVESMEEIRVSFFKSPIEPVPVDHAPMEHAPIELPPTEHAPQNRTRVMPMPPRDERPPVRNHFPSDTEFDSEEDYWDSVTPPALVPTRNGRGKRKTKKSRKTPKVPRRGAGKAYLYPGERGVEGSQGSEDEEECSIDDFIASDGSVDYEEDDDNDDDGHDDDDDDDDRIGRSDSPQIDEDGWCQEILAAQQRDATRWWKQEELGDMETDGYMEIRRLAPGGKMKLADDKKEWGKRYFKYIDQLCGRSCFIEKISEQGWEGRSENSFIDGVILWPLEIAFSRRQFGSEDRETIDLLKVDAHRSRSLFSACVEGRVTLRLIRRSGDGVFEYQRMINDYAEWKYTGRSREDDDEDYNDDDDDDDNDDDDEESTRASRGAASRSARTRGRDAVRGGAHNFADVDHILYALECDVCQAWTKSRRGRDRRGKADTRINTFKADLVTLTNILEIRPGGQDDGDVDQDIAEKYGVAVTQRRYPRSEPNLKLHVCIDCADRLNPVLELIELLRTWCLDVAPLRLLERFPKRAQEDLLETMAVLFDSKLSHCHMSTN